MKRIVAISALFVVLACSAGVRPAQAADPDYTFREAIRGLLFSVSGSPGKILVMNSASNAALVTLSGEVAIADGGVVSFASGGSLDIETNRAQVAEALLSPLASIFGSVAVETSPISTTQATVTVTCKDLAGNTMAAAKTIVCWYTTSADTTVPNETGIESWTWSGDTPAAIDLGLPTGTGTNLVRVVRSAASGIGIFTVTCDTGPWTNRFAVLGPNGSYTNLAVAYTAP